MAMERMKWREYINEWTITLETKDIYCYTLEKGIEKICEGVKYFSQNENFCYYEKENIEKIKIEDVMHIYDAEEVWDRINESTYRTYFYKVNDGAEHSYEEDIVGIVVSPDKKEISITSGQEDMRRERIGQIIEDKITNLQDVSQNSVDYGWNRWHEEEYYFVDDVDENGMGRLCRYSNGKIEELIENMSAERWFIVNQKEILFCETYDPENGIGDVCILKQNGDITKVDTDVRLDSLAVFAENNIVFLDKENDLYICNGKKSKKVESNVDKVFYYSRNYSKDSYSNAKK